MALIARIWETLARSRTGFGSRKCARPNPHRHLCELLCVCICQKVTNEDAYMHTHTQKYARVQVKLSHTPSSKQTCQAPKLNIFRRGGWEAAGSLFDVADSPKVSNEEVDYALIGAPWCVCGSGCWHGSTESHLPLSTMDTELCRFEFKWFNAQLATAPQPGVECDCLEESTGLLASAN